MSKDKAPETIREEDRFTYPREWSEQQNRTTEERGYGEAQLRDGREALLSNLTEGSRGSLDEALTGGADSVSPESLAALAAEMKELIGGGTRTMPNPAPANEVGPHLDDPEIAQLRELRAKMFELNKAGLEKAYNAAQNEN